jgi:N6-adenosine-specific RNA methylase IME4
LEKRGGRVASFLKDLCELPVAGLLAAHAHVYLWVPARFLLDCRSVFQAWGLKYQAPLICHTPLPQFGDYYAIQQEFLMLATKGQPRFGAARIENVVEATAKTAQGRTRMRDHFELVCPGPYLEVFGTGTRRQWTIIGG